MSRVAIVGQAPSRLGDGRPFTGPSGDRLCELLGLDRGWCQLAAKCDLVNLLTERQEKDKSGRGDNFDVAKARRLGQAMIDQWLVEGETRTVLACGKKVYFCLTGEKVDFFKGKALKSPFGRVEIWCFPHPSGASAFWNDPANVNRVHRFLKALQARRDERAR